MVKKIFKTAASTASTVLTVILALILACQGYLLIAKFVFKNQNPTLFGFSTAVVLTGSMSNEINPNDLIVTKSRDKYFVGDIVTYKTIGTPVTHRIIEETENGFITKGDANNTPDTEISNNDIIGKVILTVPNIGYLISFLSTPLGLLILSLLFSVIILIPSILKNNKFKGR